MLVITWNIESIKGLKPERAWRIAGVIEAARPDIVLLQEVGLGGPFRLVGESLAGIGLGSLFCSGIEGQKEKPYGNLIASHWPVHGDTDRWAPRASWQPLLARAVVETPSGPVAAYSAHIPNGSGNGWRKIDTFEALAEGLQARRDIPTILGGDFNEPKHVCSEGEIIEIIPWGGIERAGELGGRAVPPQEQGQVPASPVARRCSFGARARSAPRPSSRLVRASRLQEGRHSPHWREEGAILRPPARFEALRDRGLRSTTRTGVCRG
jgi:hypothetical protein